jgi:hypothetical protein
MLRISTRCALMSAQRHAHSAGVTAAGEGRRWHSKSGHDRYLLVSFLGVGVGVFERLQGVGERERLNNT